jgi:hypothetical protein
MEEGECCQGLEGVGMAQGSTQGALARLVRQRGSKTQRGDNMAEQCGVAHAARAGKGERSS